MPDASVVRLVDAHAARRARVDSVTLRIILKLLAAMTGYWYSEPAIAAFKKQAATAISDAQFDLGNLTAEYLDAALEEMNEKRSRKTFLMPTGLRKVDPMREWERPAEQFRYAKSKGASDEQAQQAAVNRAESLTHADVSLAQQVATVTRLEVYPQVTGYRRIIHPELSKGGTCGLCVAASDRSYKVDRLMPVHDRCKCGVLPITSKWDPGSSINLDDLAGSTAAEDLKRIRFKVEEHSELGPQLLAA